MKITKKQLQNIIREVSGIHNSQGRPGYDEGYSDGFGGRARNDDMADFEGYEIGWQTGVADAMDMQRPSGQRSWNEGKSSAQRARLTNLIEKYTGRSK
jgi:hypothetical protein